MKEKFSARSCRGYSITRTSISCPPESRITLNGRNIPVVNNIKYLGVIFNKKVTWRLYIEMFEAKTFRKIIEVYSIFKSEQLRANIKLDLHKALIRNKLMLAPPGSLWQAKIYWFCSAFKTRSSAQLAFLRRIQVRDLYMAFQLPYVYDYFITLCRK